MRAIKIISLITLTAMLSGCVVGAHHRVGHGHHRSSVHLHGHVRGSQAAGALIAGAIIGSVMTAAAHADDRDERREAKAPAPNASDSPRGPHYYRSADGRCFWVVPRADGAETRELIEDRFCEEN